MTDPRHFPGGMERRGGEEMAETEEAERGKTRIEEIEEMEERIQNEIIQKRLDKLNTLFAEFEDVTPTELPEQIDGFFKAEHTREYKLLTGYFLAMFEKKEVSERALRVCKRQLKTYSSQPAAWSYKFYINKQMGTPISEIRKDTEKIIKEDNKVYTSWNFYQKVIEMEPSYDPIPFVRKVFSYQPKNFHAWAFLTWYMKKYNKAQEVYDIALKMIDIDPLNNSPWNAKKVTAEILGLPYKEEFNFAISIMRKMPHNEAARDIALGICDDHEDLIDELDKFGEELAQRDPTNFCAYRVLLYKANHDKNTERIKKLCDDLIRTDPLRINYYNMIKEGKLEYQ